MCGIWGVIEIGDSNVLGSGACDFQKYFWKIRHRGPDFSAIHMYDRCLVGHHRLTINDDSFASNQPFVLTKDDWSYVLVCNGEIYSYRELQEKYGLSSSGNDCYALVELFRILTEEEWVGLFQNNEIVGEYAFMLVVFRHNKFERVILGRDPLGVKPLYSSSFSGRTLYVSSELKGIPEESKRNAQYRPGTLTIVENRSARVINYNPLRERVRGSMVVDLTQTIRESVINSIKRRLVTDKPMAFLLSGGVDSSIVCAVSSLLMGKKIKTFSCGLLGSTDLKYARMVAEHLGSDHHEVVFSRKEALGLIDRIVYVTESWDTTTIRASVGQYIVTKYIAENCPDIRVLMVGEGPDEVCSSYLFNWFAPSGDALDKVARRMVSRIHYYDGKRADKCSAYWGLEVRVPFLDPEFISAYWGIPADQRHPRYKNIEKWWLRDAFKDLLPEEVAWRRKEAFSDGISSVEDSWHHILKRFYEEKKTDERGYLLGKFVDLFGAHNVPVLPGYWQPEFVENSGYVDPSARELTKFGCDMYNH